jgi:predicted nucleic acid-binding protein
MIVVSHSSPVNYLVLIDLIAILPDLFGEVLIPQAVLRELQSAGTPPKVAGWISQRPGWLRVQAAAPIEGPRAEKLGDGEREAIALAVVHRPQVLLLMDEGRGRKEADRHQVRFMGTLGALDRAATLGMVDLPSAIELLLQTNSLCYAEPVEASAGRHRSTERVHGG